MKLIIATGKPEISNFIENYSKKIDKSIVLVKTVYSMEEMERLFGSTTAIGDTLLVTGSVEQKGSLTESLINIKRSFPEVRIIYFATENLSDPFTVNQLHALAEAGIYDLGYAKRMSSDSIIDMLKHPKLKIDCAEIYKAYKEGTIELKEDVLERDVSKNNIFAVTSVKPGTGKSFVSFNLAATLARYADSEKGEKAKVLLMEGDLQTLSVTTLSGVSDPVYNLKTALEKVKNYVDSHSASDWFDKAEEEKEFIRRCCLRTPFDDFFVLEGHDFDFNEIAECESVYYYYLLDFISREFDYVVVDCNSSLQHPTTDPVFQLSRTLYFVFTTEYNNIKLNLKMLEELERIGISGKIKYVLNKELVGMQKENCTFEYNDEEIIGSAKGKLRIDFAVPMIDLAVILNSTYRHIPVAYTEGPSTLIARLRFLKIAWDIAPLNENLEGFFEEVELLKKENKKALK